MFVSEGEPSICVRAKGKLVRSSINNVVYRVPRDAVSSLGFNVSVFSLLSRRCLSLYPLKLDLFEGTTLLGFICPFCSPVLTILCRFTLPAYCLLGVFNVALTGL